MEEFLLTQFSENEVQELFLQLLQWHVILLLEQTVVPEEYVHECYISTNNLSLVCYLLLPSFA